MNKKPDYPPELYYELAEWDLMLQEQTLLVEEPTLDPRAILFNIPADSDAYLDHLADAQVNSLKNALSDMLQGPHSTAGMTRH